MSDPDYAKAMYRKILILEKQKRISNAIEICKFSINRFNSEFECEDNQKCVPLFEELIPRLKD